MSQHAPVSRRSFIAGAGAAATVAVSASAALAATPGAEHASANNAVAADTPAVDYLAWVGEAPVIADDQIAQTVEADIVVVGGGNAGVMCACAAFLRIVSKSCSEILILNCLFFRIFSSVHMKWVWAAAHKRHLAGSRCAGD